MAKAKKPKLNLSRRPKAKSTRPKSVTRPSGGVSTKTRKAQKTHKTHKTAKRISSQIGSSTTKRKPRIAKGVKQKKMPIRQTIKGSKKKWIVDKSRGANRPKRKR